MSLPNKLFLSIFTAFFLILNLSYANAGDVKNIHVGLQQSELVELSGEMTHVIISDRSVAGVVKHGPSKVSVIGNGLGQADIRFMNGKRIVTQVNLFVHHDLEQIKKSLKTFFPEESIGVELVNKTIALTGAVSNAETAAKAVKIVQEHVKNYSDKEKDGNVLNLMHLRSGQQVMLRVRVGEIKRTALKNLGLGLHGIISSGSAVFGALEQDGVLKLLAEPTLTAISGQTAEFLAGGEFPVPIQGDNGVLIDYKSFGVSLDFTPFVLSENRIRLDVASEVSELSDAGSVSVASMSIPSIATRRANTTVELAPGESFMIAGLIKDNGRARIHEVPGLADIPILSPLFRSTEFKRNVTELVIAVTPYLVSPMAGDDIKLPTDGYRLPSTMEMMFFGSLGEYNKGNIGNGGLEGQVGYIVD